MRLSSAFLDSGCNPLPPDLSVDALKDGMDVRPLSPGIPVCIWSRRDSKSKRPSPSADTHEPEEGIFVTPFAVSHMPPAPSGEPNSLGYLITSRYVLKSLKPEYSGLSGPEIGALRKQGVDIHGKRVVEHPLITYTGDTTAEGVTLPIEVGSRGDHSVLKAAFKAPLVVCELTYLDTGVEKSREMAVDRGHIHIDDVAGIFGSHGWPHDVGGDAKVVFCHASAKHGPSNKVRELVELGLPGWMRGGVGIVNNDWWTGDRRDGGESVLWIG